jgi:hypothetical protein
MLIYTYNFTFRKHYNIGEYVRSKLVAFKESLSNDKVEYIDLVFQPIHDEFNLDEGYYGLTCRIFNKTESIPILAELFNSYRLPYQKGIHNIKSLMEITKLENFYQLAPYVAKLTPESDHQSNSFLIESYRKRLSNGRFLVKNDMYHTKKGIFNDCEYYDLAFENPNKGEVFFRIYNNREGTKVINSLFNAANVPEQKSFYDLEELSPNNDLMNPIFESLWFYFTLAEYSYVSIDNIDKLVLNIENGNGESDESPLPF